jgi:hypothetical protein
MSDNADPRRANDLKDMEAPKCRKSNTESDEPSRTNDLTDSEDPKCAKSKTDNENKEPTRDNPRRDMDAPRRA